MRIRILLPILATALPAFGLVIWLIVGGAAEQRDRVYERHEERAQTTAFALGQVMQTQVVEAGLLAASSLVTRPAPPGEVGAHLAESLGIVEEWRALAVVDAEGRVLAAAGDAWRGAFVGDRGYFREVVATGEPVVSEPLIPRAGAEQADGELRIVIATPVDFEVGGRGALLASLPEAFLKGAVREHVPASSRVHLVYGDGTGVAQPRWFGDAAHLSNAAQAALRRRSGAAVIPSEDGGRLLAFAPIPDRDWSVAISTPAREAFRLADDRLRNGLLLAALALGFIGVLSWSFGGRLAAAMRRVDEARGRAETASRRAALAAEASKQLSAHDSYESSIPAVARMARAELGAHCVAELVGEDGRVRRLSAEPKGASVPPEVADWPKKHRASLARGRSFVLDVAGAGDAPSGSALVAPIAQGDRLLGWMIFAAKGSRAYDDQERALAEDLGGRAAMAITSAEYYRKARESTAAREHVLSVVAHDLRTPLSTIDLTVANLARGEGLSEAARAKLERIARSSKQMQRLIRDLLEAARAESAGPYEQVAPHEVVGLVRDTAEAYRPLAAEKRITVRADVSVAESASVVCDRDRVDQVLANLVSNAIRFTPEGGLVTLSAAPAGDDEIAISVRDSGPGIRPEDVPRIFERFWRGLQNGGTGLGLAIAKAIVEAHGGRIWAESPSGGGAVISFTLPAAREGGAADR